MTGDGSGCVIELDRIPSGGNALQGSAPADISSTTTPVRGRPRHQKVVKEKNYAREQGQPR